MLDTYYALEGSIDLSKTQSPLEDAFAWILCKYHRQSEEEDRRHCNSRHDEDYEEFAGDPIGSARTNRLGFDARHLGIPYRARIESQVRCETICGVFFLDFVVSTSSGSVAYECDGREHHSNLERDEWRDAMILGAGVVDAVVRLPGPGLYWHANDVCYLASRWNPEVFSERGLRCLFKLASDEARSAEIRATRAWIEYQEPMNHIVSLRKRNRRPATPETWQTFFEFAQSLNGGNLDSIIQLWNQRGR